MKINGLLNSILQGKKKPRNFFNKCSTTNAYKKQYGSKMDTILRNIILKHTENISGKAER
jgi:hypothetical protein